jgi:hypothetical protein
VIENIKRAFWSGDEEKVRKGEVVEVCDYKPK